MNTEAQFNVNASGQLTKAQIGLLWRWLIFRILGITIPGTLIAMALHNYESPVIGIGVAILTFIFIWQYGLDLWKREPMAAYGRITKEKIRVRGPEQYYLVFSNGLRVRAPKADWDIIQDSSTYKIYYTKNTKWLLSYKLMAVNR